MFRLLFVLFIIIPIIEIAVLMQVGNLIGVWPTVAIVVVTAWLGAKNVKQQGINTLQSVQQKTAIGEMPSDEIVTGLLLLVAGVLLVTPGFVTDFFGLSLLIPQVRALLIASIQQQLVRSSSSNIHFGFQQSDVYTQQKTDSHQKSTHSAHQTHTLEGEFERKD